MKRGIVSTRLRTARFKSVVSVAGRPKTHLQLVAPEKDAELQVAIRKDRVMSVTRTVVGQRKDFARIGYDGGVVSQLLVFPKSLEKFKDCRIVGIDYSLLDEPSAKAPPPPKVKPRPAPPKVPTAAKSVKAGSPSRLTKHSPARARKKPSIPVIAEPSPLNKKSLTMKELKSKLAKVLLEWERGHDVAAHKMLARIVGRL